LLPELFDELQRFERERFALERDYKKLADEVDAQKAAEMRTVLNDIRNAIARVSKETELHVVLKAMEFDEEELEQARTAEGLVRQFRGNSILYHAPSVDITKQVIDILNADYKKSKDTGQGAK